jgi:alpha-ketoglutarate-dependent taurine dioxygenase
MSTLPLRPSVAKGPIVIQRRAVPTSDRDLIRTEPWQASNTIPLVLRPAVEGVDLFAWVTRNRKEMDGLLLKHGGLLFRNFGLRERDHFERFVAATQLEPMHYMEGATPRTDLGNRVYTSTEFPPEHRIALHNELSYILNWPMRICFFCLTSPEFGGETPIADVRRVYRRIRPEIRERFERTGWMLVRNFGGGFSLPWQRSFRTEDPREVERYCEQASIQCEWKGGGRLRTRQVRPAVRVHPVTLEHVWFNHVAFWHVSSLDPDTRQAFLAEFSEDDLPYNTYYGDGSPIETSVIDELRAAYDAETVMFPWERGDLLWMDNMLAAHGRSSFRGERKIVVSMGDPFSRTAS